MSSERSACRQTRGSKAKSMMKNDAEYAAMVASDMRRFWMVYDTEGIWRGKIEPKSNVERKIPVALRLMVSEDL